MLYGILFYSKSLLCENTLNFVEKLKGGKIWATQILTKSDSICQLIAMFPNLLVPNHPNTLRSCRGALAPKNAEFGRNCVRM